MSVGRFYGVGVGPGDPELITIKAKRVLESAPVIAVPKSGDSSGGRALSIAGAAVDLSGKELLELNFPMTRDRELLSASRRKAAESVAGVLRSGRDAAFITLGDPMLYSTFSYLMPLVRAALPEAEISVIPGVNSFSAASALLCEPLAEADEKVIIIPAAYGEGEFTEVLSSSFDTVVLMKANRNLDTILDSLKEAGLARSACLVTRAGWPEEEIVTDMESLRGRKLDYFSLLIVKKGIKG